MVDIQLTETNAAEGKDYSIFDHFHATYAEEHGEVFGYEGAMHPDLEDYMANQQSHVLSVKLGLEADPHNFLLMHAMGPNVAGVIGSAVAAGVMISLVAAP